jgi:hypothetical protein
MLGPLPEPRAALRKDLGDAFRVYITQQWSVFISRFFWASVDLGFSGLRGGSKRVNWKSVSENPEWYISRTFLLPGKPFENQTRLGEAHLRAYWRHWFDLADSDDLEFTFKRTAPPIEGAASGSDTGGGLGGSADETGAENLKQKGSNADEDSNDKDAEEAGESTEELDPINPPPNQCHTDEEKIKYLQSVHILDVNYQAVVNMVAQMMVSLWQSFVYTGLITEGISSPLVPLQLLNILLVASHGIGAVSTRTRPFIKGVKPVRAGSCFSGWMAAHTLTAQEKS